MTCLGSRTLGVKDTPFLGSVWGAKEAGKRLPPGECHLSSRSTYKHASQRHKEFTQVQAPRRLTTLLLHVWIEWYIMVSLTGVVAGANPGGVGWRLKPSRS